MSGKGGLGAAVGAGVGFMIGGPPGALALGSAGAQFGSSMDAASEAEALAKKNRGLSNEQALEIIRQSKLSAKNILKSGRELTGKQVSAFAAGGVDVGSGSSLMVMENTAAEFKRDAYEELRSSKFSATALRRRAQAQVDAAKSGKKAALIGGIANLGLTAATVGMHASSSSSGGGLGLGDSGFDAGSTSAIPTKNYGTFA